MSKNAQGKLFPGAAAEPRKTPPPKKKGAKKKPRRAPRAKAAAPHEFSAGFILYRDTPGGMVFLLLDYGKHWDYAKGHLEAGESAWQAAVRELREETGIRQVDRVTAFERNMQYVFYSPRKGHVQKTVTYFLGQTRTENVILSHEHSGYAWLSYEDAMQRLTYDNARELLRAAHDALQNG